MAVWGGGGEVGWGGVQIGSRGRGAIVVLFCKSLPQLWEISLFIREMNEPVMVIRSKTFHN